MTNRTLAAATALGLALTAAYGLLVRPRLRRWGATEAECTGEYPGQELFPGGERDTTMAVTIDAPPSSVWPWLLQMGYGRGGWYSWDRLDNWGEPSTQALHPEWQDIKVGSRLPSMPNDAAWWDVAAMEPERFLGLRASVNLRGKPFDPAEGRPRWYTDSLWGFQLKPLPGDRTRLVISGYWFMEPGWAKALLNLVFLEPAHWVMQTRQFANLKRLAEAEWASEQERTSPAADPAQALGSLTPNA